MQRQSQMRSADAGTGSRRSARRPPLRANPSEKIMRAAAERGGAQLLSAVARGDNVVIVLVGIRSDHAIGWVVRVCLLSLHVSPQAQYVREALHYSSQDFPSAFVSGISSGLSEDISAITSRSRKRRSRSRSNASRSTRSAFSAFFFIFRSPPLIFLYYITGGR